MSFKELIQLMSREEESGKTGWMSRASLSKWRGVKIDEIGQVIELNLEDNNLQGKPPMNSRTCCVDHPEL